MLELLCGTPRYLEQTQKTLSHRRTLPSDAVHDQAKEKGVRLAGSSGSRLLAALNTSARDSCTVAEATGAGLCRATAQHTLAAQWDRHMHPASGKAGTHQHVATGALQVGLHRRGLSSEGHSRGHTALADQSGGEVKGQHIARLHSREQRLHWDMGEHMYDGFCFQQSSMCGWQAVKCCRSWRSSPALLLAAPGHTASCRLGAAEVKPGSRLLVSRHR